MTQSDFGEINPPQTSGAELAELLVDFRDALHSCHKGNARPAYAAEGLIWVKTGLPEWRVMMYTGAVDCLLFHINPTTGAFRLPSNAIAEFDSVSSGTASMEGGAFFWENGQHQINNNDGGGNVNIRFAHKYNGGFKSTAVNSGAIHLEGVVDGVDAVFRIKLAPKTANVGDPVSFSKELSVSASGSFLWGGQKVFHAGNDGHNSGLDADTVDGVHGGALLRGDGSDNGSAVIRTDSGDFVLYDNSDAYFWRDRSAKKLYFGTADAIPTLRGDLDMNGRMVLGALRATTNLEALSGAVLIGAAATGNTRVLYRDVGSNAWRSFYYDNSAGAFHLQSRNGNGKIMHSGIPSGGKGSLVFAEQTSGGALAYGNNVAGSKLVPSNHASTQFGAVLSGTWKCLGYATNGSSTLFMRIV